MWDTFADAAESGPHPYDVDRYATVAAVRSGTTLVGVGSRERYRAGILALQIRGERYLDEGPGFGVNLEVFPPTGDDPPGSFLRGEIVGGSGVGHWEGDVGGSVVLGAGVGGDALEVGDSVGRFYGLLRGRMILFWRPEVTTSVTYEALPFILSPSDLAQHEHRIEIASGHGLLELGPRVAFTLRDGGVPARAFSEQTFGFFVGVGLH